MVGADEALALMVIVLGLALLLVPVVGIPRAVKRLEAARPSTSAVVASCTGVVLAVLAGLSRRLSLFYCLMGAGMNLTWLWLGVQANRRAAARAGASDRNPD